MNVKGQDDEREWTLVCENYTWRARATKGVAAEKLSPLVAVVPKSRLDAALVGSEAREREHEQRAELLRQTNARQADELSEAEARGAVLVEALKEAGEVIEAFIEWFRKHDGKADDFGRLREVVRAEDFLAALAGVVEAEPNGSER